MPSKKNKKEDAISPPSNICIKKKESEISAIEKTTKATENQDKPIDTAEIVLKDQTS